LQETELRPPGSQQARNWVIAELAASDWFALLAYSHAQFGVYWRHEKPNTGNQQGVFDEEFH
jgi:hypothetical protein